MIGFGHSDPYLSPYEEFQRFKTHPAIRSVLDGGRRISYGTRTISVGGWQSIPHLAFPGGVLVGDAAGFLNVSKNKGIHTAMKSGMIAAESIVPLLTRKGQGVGREAVSYPPALANSWVWKELYRARNIKPAFKWGLWPAIVYSAIDTYLFRGKAPWTFRHASDHSRFQFRRNR